MHTAFATVRVHLTPYHPAPAGHGDSGAGAVSGGTSRPVWDFRRGWPIPCLDWP